ncbi:MAG: hypothetical protein DLM72_17455 [Candidatus Nitrosopolaris wilkensis]|nr:MAG: hypothetical protein DLM72_17455 [Candidatus Nitrosopolaris wilkensis]
MQEVDPKDLEQRLFDTRVENTRLQEQVYSYQRELEQLYREKRTGKVMVHVKQLLQDLHFMDYAGEKYVYVFMITTSLPS